MTKLFQFLSLVASATLLTQCETMEGEVAGSGGTVTVQGTMFYPDEKGMTYRVPAGAQIIGAAGVDCVYIVENGGSVVAHTGTGNSYLIKSGGHFRGFAHPATDCNITFEAGAIVEQEETGPGTSFVGS